MSTSSRDALKEAFEFGKLPTQRDFANLIDSFVHQDEFSQWKTHGFIEVGAKGERRWRVSCPDGRTLVVAVVPAGADAERDTMDPRLAPPAEVRVDSWMAMPGRRGSYATATTRRSEPADCDGGPPSSLPTIQGDDAWHAIIASVGGSAAFEVVAQCGDSSAWEPGLFARLGRWLGLSRPDAAVLHAIAVAAGRNGPHVRSTIAPSSPGRVALVLSAVGTFLVSLATLTYAAFRMPMATCPSPWGLSCLPTLVSTQTGLSVLSAVLLLTSLALALGVGMTRNAGLRIAWRRASDGRSHDLCLRAPRSAGDVAFHVTRLW